MAKTMLYIHGNGGSPAEAERFRPLCPGWSVAGVGYCGAYPWTAKPAIEAAFLSALSSGPAAVIANSIGAYYAMCALQGMPVEKALFISPVLDMEELIRGMMLRAGVSEAELMQRREIMTASGEVLSWEYLRFARETRLRWDAPTAILYAENDELISRASVERFCSGHSASLTVMPGGEHWFHTDGQLAFLDDWVRGNI